MNRQEIFESIEKERAYQDSKFGKHFDSLNSSAHWILYIEEYLAQAKKKLFGLRIPGGAQIEYPAGRELDGVEDATFRHSVHTKEVIDKLKKVATLAIAAIEYLDK